MQALRQWGVLRLCYTTGMVYFALTCIVLLIAVLTNSLSAWLQRRHKFYDHLGPTAWNTHQFVIAPAWLVFFVMSTQLGSFVQWPLPFQIPEIGWGLIPLAVILFISAIRVLGIQALTNGNLFGVGPQKKVCHGIYCYLEHPIYDSIMLIYIGAGIIVNNGAFVIMGLIFHVLLNHIQSNLEKID